jgi:hypothetical protein
LRGGLFFLLFTTAHREDSDGKDGDGECFVFHDFSRCLLIKFAVATAGLAKLRRRAMFRHGV